MAKRELADAQHAEAVDEIDKEMAATNEAIAAHASAPDVKLPGKKRAAKNTRRPDHDKAAKKYADFEPAATGCICGCGDHVEDGVNFSKGHQNQLRSIAGAYDADKLSRDKMSDAGFEYALAQEWTKPF